MSIEKEFVPYQESLELKELDFDEPCFGYYDLDGLQISKHHWYPQNKNSSFPLPHTTNNPKISAPTYSAAFRWFREKYQLSGTPQYFTGGHYCYTINDIKDTKESNRLFTEFTSFEEAELACLRKLIEITKEKQHDVQTN